MTSEEHHTLVEIYTGKNWDIKKRLGEVIENAVIEDRPKETRSSAQNRSLHKWFTQIAQICQNQGVTWNMLIKHTVDVDVTPEGVKNLWKVLQKALYQTESTTELKKSGQIDKMVDHFALFFGKEEVEIPPFPSRDLQHYEQIAESYKHNT